MTPSDRRSFLKLLGSGAMVAAMEQSIGRALALPAIRRTGTIADVEHIIVLMQENRSFDHYFGTLQGVRGFGDARAVKLPSGQPVWNQPNGEGVVMPFHPNAPDLGLQFIQDLPHDWETTHKAWNRGHWDQWVPNKGTTTMAHLTRSDIPFHYALADAFTICDAYHASLLGPTDPNRYYLWTGWVGNDGRHGGPAIDNEEAGYGWTTFPERLQSAGISWRVYQDVGQGVTADEHWGFTENPYIGNYGDNALLYFRQYESAAEGTPLAAGAKTGSNFLASGSLFGEFRRDVASGTLPQVSWLVAPEAYTEHPNWPANYGAWYVSQILDILTANPEVWGRTALFVTYDENDGFFDHMVAPTPPQNASQGQSTISTENELFAGNAAYRPGPYGLGVRVPMLVVSPWSKGGFVNSQLFDHTSIIRFIEQRFGAGHPGLVETNITPWRRAVCGDLTSAFDFRAPDAALPAMPSTASFQPQDALRHADYIPALPSRQLLALQEPGTRPARALPYRMQVIGLAAHAAAEFRLRFENPGDATVVYQVRAGTSGQAPRNFTVEPAKFLEDVWSLDANGRFDLAVYGPNGFFRAFQGTKGDAFEARTIEDAFTSSIELQLTNHGQLAANARILDHHRNVAVSLAVPPGETRIQHFARASLSGWYDFSVGVGEHPSFSWRCAGHIENGKDSMTDPSTGLIS